MLGIGSKVTVRATPNWADEMQREDELRSCADLNTEENPKNQEDQWETQEELHVCKPTRRRLQMDNAQPFGNRLNRANREPESQNVLNGTRISMRNGSQSSMAKKVSLNSSISKPLR